MKNTTQIATLDDAIYFLIHRSDVPAKEQAHHLGVSYTRLLNCCIPSAETAYHHTRFIIPQTQRTRNFVLLDYIENALGRVGIDVSNNVGPAVGNDLLMEVAKVAQEMGEMAGAIGKSLSDNRLTEPEAARCKKETWDLITQAVKVAKMLDGIES